MPFPTASYAVIPTGAHEERAHEVDAPAVIPTGAHEERAREVEESPPTGLPKCSGRKEEIPRCARNDGAE
ncbi:MAG: hypothetical protein LBK18_03065 [Prevotellaceae bacterium]|nr:hypothetical protein [Prevotellaceae bacterium]